VPATGPVRGPALPLAPGERVAWSAWSAAPPAVAAAALAGLVPLLVLAVTGAVPVLVAVVVTLLVALVLAASLAARVSVDRRGLTVRFALGRPLLTVPLEEIAAVAAVTVRPLADFGGWGYRLGRHGRAGVVLRAGPALEVTRGDGRRFAVTVPGAAEAAAVLTALTARSRG
jgi:hypothetical protein